MEPHAVPSSTPKGKQPSKLAAQPHQCCTSVATFYPNKSSTQKSSLRRCESASSLTRNPFNPANQQMYGIQAKYQILEESYRQMLGEVQARSELFSKQRLQIEKLVQATKKVQKEIQRLKEMIRINEKKGYGSQIKENGQEHSWRKNMQVSTGESELTSQTGCDRSDCLRTRASKQRLLVKKSSSIKCVEKWKAKIGEARESRVGEGKGKEGGAVAKKFRFIPTLNLRHN